MSIEKALGVDNIPRYYITHESANESLVLTEKELEDLRNQINLILRQESASIKPKLYIHETDCHGQGYIIYDNEVKYYTYEDNADMRVAVEELINIGFVDPDDVIIIKGEEIYDYLK